MADENENNLVQKTREDRRTLEKMRRKLATSGHMGKNDVIKLKKNKKSMRIWPFAVVAAAALIGANLVLHTQQDKLVTALGGKVEDIKPPLAPPAGTSLDDQARFWTYATYDIAKLKAKFKIPRGSVVNQMTAYANLQKILADNLGAEVRKEIFIIQQNSPAPVVSKKIGGVAKKSD